MKKVVIFGLGDFAQVALEYLKADSPYEVSAFTANAEYVNEKTMLGLDIAPFETIERSHPPDEFDMFVAVGFKRVNRTRAEMCDAARAKGYKLISYVSSRAACWDGLEVGENCFIFENNVIQPFVTIGRNVIMWSGNHIGHHSSIGDHCFIASHAVISGKTRIGPYTFVGVNATTREGVCIGAENIIGAGALILKDTADKAVYAVRGTEPRDIASDEVRSFK